MKERIDKKAFGRRFRHRRDIIGVSAEVLAKAVGMRQQGIASIEAGESERPRMIIELARILGTTPEWLWWGEGPEEAPPPGASSIDEGRLVRFLTEWLPSAQPEDLPTLVRVAVRGAIIAPPPPSDPSGPEVSQKRIPPVLPRPNRRRPQTDKD